jgi:hypothetical protein
MSLEERKDLLNIVIHFYFITESVAASLEFFLILFSRFNPILCADQT